MTEPQHQDRTYYILTWLDATGQFAQSLTLADVKTARDAINQYVGQNCIHRIIEVPSLRDIPLEVEYEYLLETLTGISMICRSISTRIRDTDLSLHWHRREVGTTQWYPLTEAEIKELTDGAV